MHLKRTLIFEEGSEEIEKFFSDTAKKRINKLERDNDKLLLKYRDMEQKYIHLKSSVMRERAYFKRIAHSALAINRKISSINKINNYISTFEKLQWALDDFYYVYGEFNKNSKALDKVARQSKNKATKQSNNITSKKTQKEKAEK